VDIWRAKGYTEAMKKAAATHRVTANAGGYFEVVSGRSGKTYLVIPVPCSHVAAVRALAAGVLSVTRVTSSL